MKRRLLSALITVCSIAAQGQYATLSGKIQGANGAPAANDTLAFSLSQPITVPALGLIVPTTFNCGTSIDGTVVGIPNPAYAVVVTPQFSGTLPPGNYYVEITFSNASAVQTLVSPETVAQLTSTGGLVIQPPTTGLPQGATWNIYVGATSGSETLQGSNSGLAPYTLSIPLVTGASPPTQNLTTCQLIANDAGWPTGTGYRVTLFDPSGNVQPNFPQTWQILGAGTTINLSAGFPYYNGVTIYPTPILANPTNHIQQSISGNLSFGGYNVLNVGKLGVGTSTPGWPIDVENGAINTSTGYLYNGAAPTGSVLCGNGIVFVSQPLSACGGGSATLYYQHLQRTGTLFPQEPFANFSGNFTLTDNPGSTRTEIDLNDTSVTPGSYTNPNITVDAYGRIQTATSGPSIPVIQPLVITSGICTTGSGPGVQCSFTATWPTAFANNGYAVACSPNDTGAGGLTALMISNKTATTFQLSIQNGTASMAVATTLSEIDCVGMHP